MQGPPVSGTNPVSRRFRLAGRAGSLMNRAAGADEIVRRIDQGQMRQSLGKIPQLSFRRRIVLFRQQTNVVAQRKKPFKQ